MVGREIWLHEFPIPGTVVPRATWAEAHGFNGMLLADSQNLVGDPYVELGLAAHATTRLQLGTGNTNPVTRHPAVTAAAIATVHAESGGRAILGIARGDSAVAWIGEPPASVDDFARYLTEVQGFPKGGPVDLNGMGSRTPWIAALKQPKVPVDVAASGPRVTAIGAQLADRLTFTLGADAKRLQGAIEHARATCTAAGRDPATLSLGAYFNVAVDPDLSVARDLVRGSVGIFAHYLGEPGFPRAELSAPDREVIAAVANAYDESRHGLIGSAQSAVLSDSFVDRFAVVGPAATVRDRLLRVMALGLDRLVIVLGSRDADPTLLAETNQRFADDVLPALAP